MEAAKVSREDVIEAARRIDGLVKQTPLMPDEIEGTRVWLKCECLQTGGAFKLRGAYAAITALTRSSARA